MHCPTADSAASIQIAQFTRSRSAWDARVIERYLKKRSAEYSAQLSSNKPETLIYQPSEVRPSWLEATQQRIRESVIPTDRTEENDGRWLSQEIADSAIDFFAKTADLLPSEPFIYSSRKGDLVAEFKTEHGQLTSIVSPTFVILFAVIDGEPIETTIAEATQLRKEMGKITNVLMGQHGAVATSK